MSTKQLLFILITENNSINNAARYESVLRRELISSNPQRTSPRVNKILVFVLYKSVDKISITYVQSIFQSGFLYIYLYRDKMPIQCGISRKEKIGLSVAKPSIQDKPSLNLPTTQQRILQKNIREIFQKRIQSALTLIE